MNDMMIMALSATNMAFGERAAYAGRMLLVGMLMVFAVLTLLWGVLALSKMLFADKTQESNEENTKSVPVAPQVQAPTPVITVAPTAPVAPAAATGDAVIVAAITAAIAAARADEGLAGGFRVVSFRRADSSRAWNRK